LTRCLSVGMAVLLLVARASAQPANTIQWSLKVEETVARAKQTRQPLMFWVLGRSDSRDDRVERDQKRAFGDPLVLELSSRFATAQLSRSRYSDLLEQWDLPRTTNLEIVFVTPDGDKIDTLAPQGVRDPEVLARKMTLVYRHYRAVMFEQELKPKLEDQTTSDEELTRALKLIGQFLILSADQSVAALLERETLGSGVRAAVYETLAMLSTPASVETVLEHAMDDEQAAAALAHCTPDAAEQMLPRLEDEDPQVRLIVYHAVTQICKLRGVKPDRFWDGRNQVVKRKEIERVRELVSATAERWRQRYAEYR
jgi:hypothetical protein